MKHLTLMAFGTERRTVAVALFHDTTMQGFKIRQLPTNQEKATGSVQALAVRALEQYRPELVAVSIASDRVGDTLRVFLTAIKEVAKELGIPWVEVDDNTLFSTYSHPPIVRKEHLRAIGRKLWPAFDDGRSIHSAVDAALLGLHIQTERLFRQYEEAV